MDQQPTPVSPLASNPYPTGQLGRSSGPGPVIFILIGLLALGTIGFGILSVSLYSKANTATKTLNTQKAAAAAQAKTEQKQADEVAYTALNESPFRSYLAPIEFGSFEIKFPKNWSSFVVQQRNGTQVSLALNPEFIRRIDNADELMAARIILQETNKDQFMTPLSSAIKRGTIKQTDITVSGQHGYDLTGTFIDKKTVREVIIPVRDKVLVFSTENSKYSSEFSQILAQSKIIP